MANFSFEQSFAGSIPIPDQNTTGITNSLLINQVIPTGAVIGSIEIFNLDISHTFNADLDIRFITPEKKTTHHPPKKGSNANNYADVNFSDTATRLISSLTGVTTQPKTETSTQKNPIRRAHF